MPLKQYRTYANILVDDGTRGYFAKVEGKLDELRALTIGQNLLTELNNSGKRVVIVPARGGGNRCTSGGDGIFYRLRAAFRGANGISAAQELSRALVSCASQGWTLEKIGTQLAGGLSPATVRTVNNLRHTTTMGMAARTQLGQRIADMIEAVADGNAVYGTLLGAPHGTHSLGDDLVRFLRPWLTPGTGGGSRIEFNPDAQLGCMGDRMQPRPPAIGLAHELCHAWRNATGTRLFDDAISCGLDDDEVMTTGFPPYLYEKYTENLFRAVWRPTGLLRRQQPLRLNYR